MIDGPLEAIAFLIVGIATGLTSGTLGVGGGFILVPLLTLLGVPIHQAIGTSLGFIAIVALVGGLRHLRQSTADPLLAVSLVVVAAVLAQVGARVSDGLDEAVLALIFGIVLVAIGIWFFFGPDPEDADEQRAARRASARPSALRRQRERLLPSRTRPLRYEVDLRKAAGVGAVVGFTSGMFGVGGGFLMVPLLTLVMAIPLPIAIGTDLFGVVVTAASGVIAHILLGNVLWDVLLVTVPGGMVAAALGARLSVRLSPPVLRLAFLCVLLLGSLKLLYDGSAAL